MKLEFVEIPRRIRERPSGHFRLSLFTDASEQAMAACIYVTDLDAERPTARLLCAKTRLAPKKTQTVPRLELCAMLLGAKLLAAVRAAIDPIIWSEDRVEIYAYTDSTTALTWVKAGPGRWATFVANRVRQVHELMDPAAWSHVPGEENPADLATRYQREEMAFLDKWWSGPTWLTDEIIPFFLQPQYDPNLAPDSKKAVLTTFLYDDRGIGVLPIGWASDLGRLLRVTRIVLRVCRLTTEVTLHDAMMALVRQDQRYYFLEELELLKKGQPVQPSSPLRRLNPKLWEDGIIRLGGGAAHAGGSQSGDDPAHSSTQQVCIGSTHRQEDSHQALPRGDRPSSGRTAKTILGLTLKVLGKTNGP